MKGNTIKALTTACALALATSSTAVMAESGMAERHKDDMAQKSQAHSNKDASDLWAKASLTTTYTLNRHLNPFEIDTEINGGVATLKGTVESETERQLAEELALGVKGITKVNNQLTIDPAYTEKHAKMDKDRDIDHRERSFMQKVEDATLTASVKSQLLWNNNTEGLSIDVDTKNGIVQLNGTVNSKTESQLAEQIARNTSDVMGVKNNLKISEKKMSTADKAEREAKQASSKISDSWISTKVKAALMYNRTVDGTDINVDTKDGVVSLRGQVDSDFERKQAIAIADSIKGVKGVKAALSEQAPASK